MHLIHSITTNICSLDEIHTNSLCGIKQYTNDNFKSLHFHCHQLPTTWRIITGTIILGLCIETNLTYM